MFGLCSPCLLFCVTVMVLFILDYITIACMHVGVSCGGTFVIMPVSSYRQYSRVSDSFVNGNHRRPLHLHAGPARIIYSCCTVRFGLLTGSITPEGG